MWSVCVCFVLCVCAFLLHHPLPLQPAFPLGMERVRRQTFFYFFSLSFFIYFFFKKKVPVLGTLLSRAHFTATCRGLWPGKNGELLLDQTS